EKVDMDVEAEAEGILRRLVAEGTLLKPGDIVGALLAPGETLPASFPAQPDPHGEKTEKRDAQPAASTPTARPASASGAPPGGEERLRVTPVARRLAAERGVDLTTVRGSGPEGRILERDVQQAMEQRRPIEAAAPAGSPPPAEMN